jgi:ATP-binding cassette subfamily B protein
MIAKSHQEENFGKAYDLWLIRRLWRFIVPYRALFGLGLMLLPLQQIFGLAQPIIMKVAIDRYIEGANIWGLGVMGGGDLLLSVLLHHACGSEIFSRLEGSYFFSCAKASHERL